MSVDACAFSLSQKSLNATLPKREAVGSGGVASISASIDCKSDTNPQTAGLAIEAGAGGLGVRNTKVEGSALAVAVAVEAEGVEAALALVSAAAAGFFFFSSEGSCTEEMVRSVTASLNATKNSHTRVCACEFTKRMTIANFFSSSLWL